MTDFATTCCACHLYHLTEGGLSTRGAKRTCHALIWPDSWVGAGLLPGRPVRTGPGPIWRRRIPASDRLPLPLLKRKTKSDLGWAFIGLIDGGRIKEYADDGADITRIYRHQLAACTYEVLPGPGRLLRWSVPPSRGHDDLLISTALTARLDEIDWRDRRARGTAPTDT